MNQEFSFILEKFKHIIKFNIKLQKINVYVILILTNQFFRFKMDNVIL